MIEFEEEGHGLNLGRLLGEREFASELREELGDGVLVTRDGPRVFLYTGTPGQAAAAREVVREVLAEHGMDADVSEIARWHPAEEAWRDATEPVPQSPDETEAERERREELERREAPERGYAEWEVRVDLASHGDAVDFADRLEAEGIKPVTRRWKYVLIGTATEDDANDLAERLRGEVPSGATVRAEPSATIEWELASRNPFSLFGGFGPRP